MAVICFTLNQHWVLWYPAAVPCIDFVDHIHIQELGHAHAFSATFLTILPSYLHADLHTSSCDEVLAMFAVYAYSPDYKRGMDLQFVCM